MGIEANHRHDKPNPLFPGSNTDKRAKLAVVGAGYAGVEVAAAIKEKYSESIDVSIWDPMFDVLPMAGDSERNYVRSSLTVTRPSLA